MTRAYLRRKSFAFGMGTAFAGLQNHNRLDKLVRNGVRMAAAAVRGDSERTLYHETRMREFFRLLAWSLDREIAPRRVYPFT